MFLDNALVIDPQTGRCGLAFDGSDLLLDDTPATPMIISLLANRRARPDDALPQATTDFYTPGTIMARQGWVGDALDPTGQLIGSRLWLTNGAKASLDTQQLAESASAEGLDHFRALNGLNVGVKARYASREMLALVCVVAKTQITLNRVLS